MLALRLIAPNDYRVLEGRQPIGRIRLARGLAPTSAFLSKSISVAFPLSDVSRAATTVCLEVTDASSATAPNYVTSAYVWW